jgi:hypothetical protein
MRDLKLEHFAGNVGKTYDIVFTDAVLPATLEQAQATPGGLREDGGFRLQFRGPPEPILTQGIFTFRLGEQCDDIFIVPIGRDENGAQYEAIFT